MVSPFTVQAIEESLNFKRYIYEDNTGNDSNTDELFYELFLKK